MALFMFAAFANAQNVIGKWKTIDDETGKAKSVVELFVKDGKLYGKIVKLLNNDDLDPICYKCTGKKKDQKIIGMQIIEGLKKKGSKWEGDDGILDPGKGKIYDCKMWVDGQELKVRGYLGPFYRTQTWYRLK